MPTCVKKHKYRPRSPVAISPCQGSSVYLEDTDGLDPLIVQKAKTQTDGEQALNRGQSSSSPRSLRITCRYLVDPGSVSVMPGSDDGVQTRGAGAQPRAFVYINRRLKLNG